MEKINFNKQDDIDLNLFSETGEITPVGISILKTFSWSKIIVFQSFLDSSCESIKKWYWSRKNLENIIDGYPDLWLNILDALAELFLTDFANYKVYDYKKKDIIEDLNNEFGQLFNSIFDDIKSVWGGLTSDQIESEAYRALRKENRGRMFGIGFGFKGAVGSAIGAELGNLGTGLIHSVINTVGNFKDNISTNKKMNDYYNQKSTLENIINYWIIIFWRMYDVHIEKLNYWILEEDSPDILNYTQMLECKISAESYYENMQRTAIEDEMELVVGSLKCLNIFPFEPIYWKIILKWNLIANYGGTKKISQV
ncbi:hypothetical protein [Treponema sp. R80B11-R83G3]